MNLIESSWFLISFLIILIVLVVDPKSSITGGSKNAVLGLFSSPSSGECQACRILGDCSAFPQCTRRGSCQWRIDDITGNVVKASSGFK